MVESYCNSSVTGNWNSVSHLVDEKCMLHQFSSHFFQWISCGEFPAWSWVAIGDWLFVANDFAVTSQENDSSTSSILCFIEHSVFFDRSYANFSALMLLAGWQERHPACKNWVVRCWHGYLSGARCKWFAYGPADANVTPSSLAPVKSRMVYLTGTGLPRLSWKKAVSRV